MLDKKSKLETLDIQYHTPKTTDSMLETEYGWTVKNWYVQILLRHKETGEVFKVRYHVDRVEVLDV